MKVNIYIDCTPKEARTFSDLVDFKPVLILHDFGSLEADAHQHGYNE